MADTTKYFLTGADTVTMSTSAADKLIHSGNGDAALLYLLILRRGGELSVNECTGALGRTEYEVGAAFSLLEKLGLVRRDGERTAPPVEAEVHEYTAEDIRNAARNGSPFAPLVAEVQKLLGKVLSSDDLIRLFGIYDSLGLPPEVILHLVSHCICETRRKSGEGRMPTMRYIEKAAYEWERSGVNTLDLAEERIRAEEEHREAAAEIQRALQIRDRRLSATEKRYIDGWIAMGYGPEEISIAYDRTVVKTGRLTWAYMNSIIESWHTRGLHTAAAILKGDGRNGAQKRGAAQKTGGSAGVSAEELDNMRKFLDRMKKED